MPLYGRSKLRPYEQFGHLVAYSMVPALLHTLVFMALYLSSRN